MFLSVTQKKTSGEGEAKGVVKDSNGDDNDNENDNKSLTFAAVLSVSNKSRFACTVVGSPSVATNGIDMATMQAFLTFVDIYG